MGSFFISDIALHYGLEWFGVNNPLEGLNLVNRDIQCPKVLSFCTKTSFLELSLSNPNVGAVIIPPELKEASMKAIANKGFIVSTTPEWTFYKIFEDFINSGFFKTNCCHSENLPIVGSGVVIEENVSFGKNVRIGHNSIIKQNTVIGDNVVIGNSCIIGADGFQIVYDPHGHPHAIHHVGSVRIGSHVTIADCVTINRSLFEGATTIGNFVKINSHSHIAHNVKIGENTVITSFVNMFGSSSVGKNVWIAPNTAIMNKVHIGDGSFIGASSLVLQDISTGAKAFGHPAKER